MGLYSELNELWRSRPEELKVLLRERRILWRREPSVVRVERPLRLDRARGIGYKAKQGFVVLRVRVRRGGFSKPRPNSGRRPKAIGAVLHKVNVTMAEEAINRARKKYPNLHPIGCYPLTYDSLYKWFEVILVDPYHPAIRSDPEIQLPDPLRRRVERRLMREKSH
ncbi:MAG: 50S ribosomal protein L15e [Nitrososphaerota archaeon]|nr:50S ribosomal protein L15e [Candidatus Calditenuaceae archaeon]MDW8073222.1 50S ribosomal protein L15e [Nitrososphaerota archaeon]